MNGYNYNGGYDSVAMNQHEQYAEPDTMMMGQEGVGAGNGMVGGQSLDDIVNQSAKTIRRQSMPQQQHSYSSNPGQAEGDMRRVSMMEYNGASPAGPMNHYGYDQNAMMDQSGIMPGASPAHTIQNHPRRSQSRRESQDELGLNTGYNGAHPGYHAMMQPPYAASPAHTQGAVDLGMNSPYIDPNLGMPMDYGVQQVPHSAMGGDAMNMNMQMYNQPQFSNSAVSSPMHQQAPPQNIPNVPRSTVQDQGGNSGMNTQYGNHTTHSGSSTARNLSRSNSLHVNPVPSPAHSATPNSQPASNGPHPPPAPRDGNNNGFKGQPQHPKPGSKDDRGMGDNRNQKYDGLNGPFPVDPANYNPNNQGFAWEAPEGGWPSTMVGRPHMQSSYKNAYSSTGFDMLGVLVCSRAVPDIPALAD